MRKNLFKKLVAVVAATAMAVTALLAAPQEVSAATEKTIYLEVETDDTYGLGLWEGGAGLTLNADLMDGSDWVYAFTKVEDGLYKMSVTVDGTVSIAGLEVYNSAEKIAASDAQWSTDKTMYAALAEALNSDATEVKISGYNAETWAFDTVEEVEDETEAPTTAAPAGDGEGTTTAAPSGDKTPDTGDSTMLFALVAVAVVASAVVLKKRTVTE